MGNVTNPCNEVFLDDEFEFINAPFISNTAKLERSGFNAEEEIKAALAVEINFESDVVNRNDRTYNVELFTKALEEYGRVAMENSVDTNEWTTYIYGQSDEPKSYFDLSRITALIAPNQNSSKNNFHTEDWIVNDTLNRMDDASRQAFGTMEEHELYATNVLIQFIISDNKLDDGNNPFTDYQDIDGDHGPRETAKRIISRIYYTLKGKGY